MICWYRQYVLMGEERSICFLNARALARVERMLHKAGGLPYEGSLVVEGPGDNDDDATSRRAWLVKG